MSDNESTVELVRRLKQGDDESAVDELVARFGHRLLSAAYMLCNDYGEAEDLMIRTLRQAVVKIGGFREEASFFSWLYRILFNFNRMGWRKKSRQMIVYSEVLPERVSEEPEVGEGLDRERRAVELAAVISRLSPVLQEVVVLRYYDDMSHAEIAATLGVRLGTVKSRLFNAHTRLRELVPDEFRGEF